MKEQKKSHKKPNTRTVVSYGLFYAAMLGATIYCIVTGSFDMRLPLWIYIVLILCLLQASHHLAVTGQSSRSYYMDRLNADLGPYQIFPFGRFVRFLFPAVVCLVLFYIFW